MEKNIEKNNLLNEDSQYATLPGGNNLFSAEIEPDISLDYQFNVSESMFGLNLTYESKG